MRDASVMLELFPALYLETPLRPRCRILRDGEKHVNHQHDVYMESKKRSCSEVKKRNQCHLSIRLSIQTQSTRLNRN